MSYKAQNRRIKEKIEELRTEMKELLDSDEEGEEEKKSE